MIVDFIDEQRAAGHAVESICAVLTSLGAPIAARTYRAAKAAREPSPGVLRLAYLMNEIHTRAFVLHPATGGYRLRPEGLYGRRKMTALVRRSTPNASRGSVDRAMRTLGLQGVRRGRGVRTTAPAKDGRRAGDLLDRNFTADAPNRTWVMDFT
ncbi:hypothetical protein MM440_12015 [Arsenicicoccus piscis]|uniref:HTH-like domain-containing protein n=1 Tax=Arsenicicoccus piscis TaxID=673954 RepID=A0ABQ6HNC4_9MICO|nr:hypothetical protein [Arsenicicoccus piscis]MCH8628470.1 hypothetical protein [Arsenicicoccus piscis]GMA19963.1 hypothetical protein GCM10025862_19840 [Arsenicicoccus piscis]